MINDYEATNDITDANYSTAGTENTTTSATNDDVISTLNDLITTNKDGQDGFKTAAEGIERSDLKTLFYEFSQQRSEFAGVLQGLVRNLGGDPENSGSVSAALHRGWIDIKSLVTGKDEGAILNECERGEDVAKDAYQNALKINLPSDVRDVVSQQSQAILAAHNRIKALRNAENSTGSDTNSYTASQSGT